MLKRFRDLENLSVSIFRNPYKFLKNGWNHIDIGIVLLGCEQLEKSLFLPHKSGKTYLNYLQEMYEKNIDENLSLVGGLDYHMYNP